MAVYRFNATIRDDHNLAVPVDIPPGEVTIVIETTCAAGDGQRHVLALLDEICASNEGIRTLAEIDAELAELRSSWESD